MPMPIPQPLELKAKLYRGFADPSRLAILEALRQGPLTVTQIVEAAGLSQSNVSNHLGCLRDCGLVAGRQDGRYVYYRHSDPRVQALLDVSDELLANIARGIDACMHYRGEAPPEAE
ncbi:MAG: transcriptional regulator [Maritimibacter sp.]|nr:transcriptional regulator [Maritimibacter sp.]|tara:strand:+ start:221 stop:571 length:351 start_codon:yes stop_codon:yes gene_type:complete